jgi:DNA gyrase subunit A
MARVREGAAVLTVTEKGLGRRCALESYRIQNRGGFGMLNYKTSDTKGYVCGIKVVDDTDDIIMISSDGIIIRLRACDIRIMGRYATGVRLMRVGESEKVVAFTRTEHEEDAEITAVEDNGEEDVADPENEDLGEAELDDETE